MASAGRPWDTTTLANLLRVLTIAAFAAAWSADASAQIYSWRDASGVLTLSDHRPTDGVPTQTFRVENTAEPIRTTRPGQRTNSISYDQLIEEHAAANRLRPDLVRAVIQVESGFNPLAVSPKGALGLMQLMPGTARDLRVSNPFDPTENIRGGTVYLRQLLERFGNNEELALAAYNAGPEAVNRYGQRVPPYRETRSYVQKVKNRTALGTAAAQTVIYKVPEIVDGEVRYNFTDKKPESGPFEILPRR